VRLLPVRYPRFYDVSECVKIRNRNMGTPVPAANPRGSPRVRLVSSLAMLALVIGGVSFYSVRKTNDLLEIGVNDHVQCVIAGTYPRQTQRAEMLQALGTQFAPMLQPLLDALGPDCNIVSAHQCMAAGRAYTHMIFQRGPATVSVILTRRSDQEVFPRMLSALHEGSQDGYSVAGFESGGYLAFIISELPRQQNSELARRLTPIIDRFTKI
jgi:hypothetical protein